MAFSKSLIDKIRVRHLENYINELDIAKHLEERISQGKDKEANSILKIRKPNTNDSS
jgi:hypothetical protein